MHVDTNCVHQYLSSFSSQNTELFTLTYGAIVTQVS